MTINNKLTHLAAFIGLALATSLGHAADTTPLGAEQGANADGSIPAWDGGITKPPAGYKKGMHHPDPFAADKKLLTITAANAKEHTALLTAGHQAMFKTYPDTFKMHVYPTQRSASAPQHIYDATQKNGSSAKLINDGASIANAGVGIPFPKPTEGLHVIWNHILRWRGEQTSRHIAQAAPSRGGSYTLVKFEDEFYQNYSRQGQDVNSIDNIIAFFKQEVTAPARLAGSILLVHETLDQKLQPRKAWVYNPGQRRVRRAPNVAFDNPGTAADGMRTSDQFDMFNGSPERYDWQLVGKKELYVPYNSYKLHSDSLTYKDILTPLHINPEYARYEKHRVWVVEATLKEGERHIYKRRTFYVDEDSWQIVAVDQYDNRDQLWRVSEGHGINYYEVPTYWTTLEVHNDLQAGRYLAIGLDNESKMYDFEMKRSPKDYTTAALRRAGKR